MTNATACAVPCPNVAVVSKGNTGDLIATGTVEGKVNIWRFDCGLKLVKFVHVSPYDSIFSGILTTDYNKVWSTSLEKDSCKYFLQFSRVINIIKTTITVYSRIRGHGRIKCHSLSFKYCATIIFCIKYVLTLMLLCTQKKLTVS